MADPMSQKSRQLAAYARRAMKSAPADQAKLKAAVEEFSRLQANIREEFDKQIADFREEPDCASVLFHHFSGDIGQIKRTDDPLCVVTVKFDTQKLLVSFRSDKPLKFRYFIEVKPNNNGTTCFYVAGEKRSDLDPTDPKIVPWAVESSLCALFNVDRS